MDLVWKQNGYSVEFKVATYIAYWKSIKRNDENNLEFSWKYNGKQKIHTNGSFPYYGYYRVYQKKVH